ncbi:Facilitated glucose transporter protein 1 [Caenorhabditis elegans]|uniref:Isoform a of Facilitated glucose transporter protein 1 n=1 Tax=Caenorhabditis elegans TaxID=6239 RepID=O44827-2|nr:Facilitated glucose transporter protein 1 [Caenorhabditis elegans]CCD72383.1 Facilitated glucose transporter protein 1 [Caenorhabditis elegans]|eukprot:NP_493981.1 Facilitated glucose transporter protein 1 [Caenorhabditis elegans]
MGVNDHDVSVPLQEVQSRTVEGKLTKCLAFSAFVITLASFQFGYHIGCVNAPGGLITEWIIGSHKDLFDKELSRENADLAWSVAVSVFAVGGMIGGLSSGWLADKVGRRGALFYNNLLALAAAALMGLAKSVGAYPMVILGRLIIGLNCGFSSALVPMFLTEISPNNLRGMLGSLHQLLVTIAILVSQIFGLPHLLGTGDRWPLIFAFTVVPAVLQLALLMLCPESPKYTMAVRGQRNEAESALKKLRDTEDVSTEIEAMQEEATAAGVQEKPKMGDMFKGALLWPMSIAIMMMLAQQLSGINVAMFYSTVIFRGAGLTGNEPFYATIGMGAVNVIMTLISVWLVDHPKFGRRSLLLAGLTGMFVSTLLLVGALTIQNSGGDKWASYSAIGFVLLFVISFATGPGAIPWFFVSEIFDSSARGNANSIAVMVNWAANLLVGLTFLPINNLMQQYSFFIFSGFLAFFIFYTWKFVPETKGKSIEQIQAEFEKRK